MFQCKCAHCGTQLRFKVSTPAPSATPATMTVKTKCASCHTELRIGIPPNAGMAPPAPPAVKTSSAANGHSPSKRAKATAPSASEQQQLQQLQQLRAAAASARRAAAAEEDEEDTDEPLPLPTALLHWHWANLEYANGTQLSSLSNRWWDADDEFDFAGAHYLLPGGYGGLLQKVAAGLDIRFGHEATQVTRTASGGVRVAFRRVGGGVATGQDSGTLEADSVVCTLPLGVLKTGALAFEPPLPMRKQDAIERLGFGALNKVLLVFSHPFWEKAEGGRDFFGVCAPTAQRRGEAFQFWNLHRCTGQPMLLALHAGRAAKHKGVANGDTAEAFEAAAIESTLGYLRTVFGSANVPSPVRAMVTRWHEDPYARGVYSHVALGASARDYDTMAEPLWGGALLWAGEATCRSHPATVAGAFISGVREAGRFACNSLAQEQRRVREQRRAQQAKPAPSLSPLAQPPMQPQPPRPQPPPPQPPPPQPHQLHVHS
jgi:monoamine oxidase